MRKEIPNFASRDTGTTVQKEPLNTSLHFFKLNNAFPCMERLVVFLRSRIWLALLGLSSEMFYFFYLLHDFPLTRYYQGLTDMEAIEQYTHAGFLKFLITFTLLFALFGLAWYEVRKLRGTATLWLILTFSAIFSVTMIFVYPVTAIDVFGYIVRSIVMIQYHANPMITAPAQFARHDPLMNLAGEYITLPSSYGPLALVIQAIPTAIAGRNVLLTLLIMKIIFSTMLLVTAFFVYKILAHIAPRFALAGTLALAWNPFALFEYSANSHNDIAMMLFIVVAVYALTKERYVLALICVVASALIKFASLPLIPLFFTYGLFHQSLLEKRVTYIAYSITIPTLLTIACFLPFWAGLQTLIQLLNQMQYRLYSFSVFLTDFTSGTITYYSARQIGLDLFGGCFLYALWKATKGLSSMLEACFITIFGLLAFGATYIQVWYIIWPVVLALLIPKNRTSLAAFLLVYAATIVELIPAYIWAWGGYRSANTIAIVNSVVYLALFSPTLLLLFGSRLAQVFSANRLSRKFHTKPTNDNSSGR